MAVRIRHLQHDDRKDYDKIRDERLEKVGIKVYRIKWKSINNENGKKYIKNEINKFLDFYHSYQKSPAQSLILIYLKLYEYSFIILLIQVND